MITHLAHYKADMALFFEELSWTSPKINNGKVDENDKYNELDQQSINPNQEHSSLNVL